MLTVSQKGQVTIPIEVRDRLGIHPSDEARFEETDHGYVLQKQVAEERFTKWYGTISSYQPMAKRMQDLRGRPLTDENTSSDGDSDV
ncbi:AbrB/MazE/SpoVT family DNA-binding domain-containing protein [Haladaptatus sp. DYF46]|uniref:AbrB/MazE/SpoVT family DNA-binding domain-containing protein n=1 Tax=Haladaptatus sp. DYF46 TaxID=2886041 RepID=UPI001E35CEC1|nr:AbrB/MazE/SpoVT family DNA-binding domain-containing protein [Haladaptatus sp. DYF46]